MTQQPEEVHLVPPVGEHDHVRGPADAPITLVEYGDYDCPYAVRAYSVVNGLRERLGDRLRFVYRSFPLTEMHANAQAAAQAAEAAAAQGKFWEMHDKLFEANRKLEGEDLRRYAQEAGLDLPRFERETAEHAHAGRVREDVESALASEVQETPTFVIDGVRYYGSEDLETLLAAMEGKSGEAPVQGSR
jgi:NhaA family Na+:H+ antiporter